MTEIVAHRGASAYAPENTLAAYDLAVEQGADTIELDVRTTADGDLVLVHDLTLMRTAGEATEIRDLDRAALARLDPMLRPPSIEEVLSRYPAEVRFLIDVKDPTPDWELRVVDAVERHGLRGRASVQSFELDGLARLHRAAPWLPLAALFRRRDTPRLRLDEVAPFACGIGPWHGAVDAELVAQAHARGMAVRPWTVDEAGEAERLLELGVDGVITNAPDVIRSAAARLADAA
jgi:glycerophosphoryl diester phosphodiesterase